LPHPLLMLTALPLPSSSPTEAGFDDLWAFSFLTHTWAEVPQAPGSSPGSRHLLLTVVVDGLLLLYGGSRRGQGDVWALELGGGDKVGGLPPRGVIRPVPALKQAGVSNRARHAKKPCKAARMVPAPERRLLPALGATPASLTPFPRPLAAGDSQTCPCGTNAARLLAHALPLSPPPSCGMQEGKHTGMQWCHSQTCPPWHERRVRARLGAGSHPKHPAQTASAPAGASVGHYCRSPGVRACLHA